MTTLHLQAETVYAAAGQVFQGLRFSLERLSCASHLPGSHICYNVSTRRTPCLR